jgi:hypothetical protein
MWLSKSVSMGPHAFTDPQVLVSLFLSFSEVKKNDSLLRVLDNKGIPRPKDGSRLFVVVDLSLLKLAGLCGYLLRDSRLHRNGWISY